MIDVKKLYNSRFSSFERVRKEKLWKILCREFLQKFIHPTDTIVDLGAGECEFINNIHGQKKIAVDINKHTQKLAAKNVQVITASVKKPRSLFDANSIDVVFMSNLLEHMENKEDVFRILRETYLILKPKGRLLIMQPDIKLVGGAYWDFFDHKVPLTLASINEALRANDYTISYTLYPFLPYSTKVRFLPLWPQLLKLYLPIRPLHFIFGKQFFLCASKA